MFAKNITNINNFYSFTIVRNPYDKFLSSYYFYRDIYNGKRKINVRGYVNFEDFTLNFRNFRFKDDAQFIPQYKYISKDVDYIGHFENLDYDWQRICMNVGATYYKLPTINSTTHWHWQSLYTPKMREIVFALFKKDFELFQYKR